MIGMFSSPPEGEPAADADEVKYIGETHGRTTSLFSRLRQFGNSAGFNGKCKNGHYAAWWFYTLLDEYAQAGDDEKEQERVQERCWKNGTSHESVYVALVPVPEAADWVSNRRDAPGVLPGLYESMLLWQYVHKNGVMPPLNNSGSQASPENLVADRIDGARNAPASADVQTLLAAGEQTGRMQAAMRIAEAIASAWGYKGKPQARHESGDDYASRTFGGRGRWLCVGWSDSGAVDVSLWGKGDECIWQPTNGMSIDTEELFRSAVDELLRKSLL